MLAVAVIVGLYSELFRLLPDVRQALISFHLSPQMEIHQSRGRGRGYTCEANSKEKQIELHVYTHIHAHLSRYTYVQMFEKPSRCRRVLGQGTSELQQGSIF